MVAVFQQAVPNLPAAGALFKKTRPAAGAGIGLFDKAFAHGRGNSGERSAPLERAEPDRAKPHRELADRADKAFVALLELFHHQIFSRLSDLPDQVDHQADRGHDQGKEGQILEIEGWKKPVGHLDHADEGSRSKGRQDFGIHVFSPPGGDNDRSCEHDQSENQLKQGDHHPVIVLPLSVFLPGFVLLRLQLTLNGIEPVFQIIEPVPGLCDLFIEVLVLSLVLQKGGQALIHSFPVKDLTPGPVPVRFLTGHVPELIYGLLKIRDRILEQLLSPLKF